MLSYGESSSYSAIDEANCVNHLQKRMAMALQNLV